MDGEVVWISHRLPRKKSLFRDLGEVKNSTYSRYLVPTVPWVLDTRTEFCQSLRALPVLPSSLNNLSQRRATARPFVLAAVGCRYGALGKESRSIGVVCSTS